MATVTESAEGADDGEVEAPPEPPTWYAGPYAIVAPIAAGGGGSVWLARDTRSSDPARRVAVKFLHPDAAKTPSLRRRFLREAEFAASIHHPNVVEVTEVGDASGHPYLVMPFVEGTTLRELLRRGQLPLEALVAIVSDALRGLTAAHDARGSDGEPLELVHRDISPHNLLVALDGTTKLTDFGIARPAQNVGVSTTRWAQGKVSYFSPEQGRGEPLDRRSDLFAMGIVLWECLTGRSLFRADDPFVTAHRVQTMQAPAPSTLRRGVTADLDEVVATALAIDREARYPTAARMLEALGAAAAAAGIEPSRAAVATLVARVAKETPPLGAAANDVTTRDPAPPTPAPPPRRRAVAVGVAAVAAVAVALIALAWSLPRSRATSAAPRADDGPGPAGALVAAPSAPPPPTATASSSAPPPSTSPTTSTTATTRAEAPAPPPSRSKKSAGASPRRRELRPPPTDETQKLPSPTNPF